MQTGGFLPTSGYTDIKFGTSRITNSDRTRARRGYWFVAYRRAVNSPSQYRKTSNKGPGGNKSQTCLRPGCYWRQALIRGPVLIKSSIPVHPAPIRGRLLLEARRLLEVHRNLFLFFKICMSLIPPRYIATVRDVFSTLPERYP